MHWLLCLDQQLLAVTGQGLVQFFLEGTDQLVTHSVAALAQGFSLWATEVPQVIVLAADQGSGGWQAFHYLVYACHARCMMLNDPSHRGWNGLKKAMVDTGLWPFILILVVVLNLDFGPWDGSSFHQRGLEAMQ
eukprot:8226436-Lingulodinium_polyedra.AAC.1